MHLVTLAGGRPRTIRVPVDEGGVQVQEVKVVRRAASRSSSFITTFFIAYFIYRIVESRDPFGLEQRNKTIREDFDKWKKEHENDKTHNDIGPHWERQHAQINSANSTNSMGKDGNTRLTSEVAQITIPVWIRAKQQPLYKPSDPEFREYVKLQSDKKKMDDLKRTVGTWAGARLQNPAHEVNLAAIGFTGRVGLSLDIVPQLYPPPLYEVPCIVFADGKVSLAWRTLSPQLGARMDSVFRPGVTFDATKVAMTTFGSAFYAITRAKVGKLYEGMLQSSSSKPSSETFPKPPALAAKAILSEKDIAKDNAIPPKANWPSDKRAVQELLRAIHNGKATREGHQEIVKAVPYATAVQLAAASFKRAQVLGHAAVKQANTRGALQIRGVVSCFGERGVYRLEVIAFYQPAEDAFLGPIVVRNAYVLMNYNQWQQWEEKRQQMALLSMSKGTGKSASSGDGTVSSTSEDEKS